MDSFKTDDLSSTVLYSLSEYELTDSAGDTDLTTGVNLERSDVECNNGILSDTFLKTHCLQASDFGDSPPSDLIRSNINCADEYLFFPRRESSVKTFTPRVTTDTACNKSFAVDTKKHTSVGRISSNNHKPFTMDISKCRKFSGLAYENAAKFMQEFQSYVNLYSLAGDPDNHIDDKRVPLFHLLLHGPAQTWFNTNKLHDQKWEVVQQAFQDEYTKLSASSPALLLEVQNFVNMTLSPHEPLEDFYARLIERGQRVGKSDVEILSKFISALPEKLQFFVSAGQPMDSHSALTAAQMGSLYGFRSGDASVSHVIPVSSSTGGTPTSVSHVAPVSSTSTNADLNSIVEKLNTVVDKMANTHLVNLETHERYGRSPDITTSRVRERAPDRTSPYNRAGFITCHRCGGKGHKQFECLWNGQGIPSPDVICQLCCQDGHTALTCGQLNYQAPARNSRHNSPGHVPPVPYQFPRPPQFPHMMPPH